VASPKGRSLESTERSERVVDKSLCFNIFHHARAKMKFNFTLVMSLAELEKNSFRKSTLYGTLMIQ
jgi:hypothetical protein